MLQTLIILLDAIILFLFFRAMYRKILMTPINKFVEKSIQAIEMANEIFILLKYNKEEQTYVDIGLQRYRIEKEGFLIQKGCYSLCVKAPLNKEEILQELEIILQDAISLEEQTGNVIITSPEVRDLARQLDNCYYKVRRLKWESMQWKKDNAILWHYLFA